MIPEDDWAYFTPIQYGNQWAFLTAHDRYLMAHNSNGDWKLFQNSFVAGWEKFTMVPQ